MDFVRGFNVWGDATTKANRAKWLWPVAGLEGVDEMRVLLAESRKVATSAVFVPEQVS